VQQAHGKKPRILKWAAVAVVRVSRRTGLHDPDRPGFPGGCHRFSQNQPLSRTSQGLTRTLHYTTISVVIQEIIKSKSTPEEKEVNQKQTLVPGYVSKYLILNWLTRAAGIHKKM